MGKLLPFVRTERGKNSDPTPSMGDQIRRIHDALDRISKTMQELRRKENEQSNISTHSQRKPN